MNTLFLFNFGSSVAAVTIGLAGLIVSLFLRRIQKWSKNFFVIMFAILWVYAWSNVLFLYTSQPGSTFHLHAVKIFYFTASLSSSSLMPMVLLFISHQIKVNRDGYSPPLLKAALRLDAIVWGLYIFLLCLAQITKYLYEFTPDNQLVKGPFYQILMLPALVILIINILVLILSRSYLRKDQRIGLWLFVLFPLAGVILQIVFFGMMFIVLSSSLAAYILFTFIVKDSVKEHTKNIEQIADQKMSLLTLQMRPHFICNTLLSIYYLCDADTEKAKHVIKNYTEYLRKNFTAMSKDTLVPFENELEHTRAYLEVEKVRFEGQFNVEFDTPNTSFVIPSLTLQPLVENSVKHGVDPEADPVDITVRTLKKDGDNIIIVEDTGTGGGKSDGEGTHVAFENIKTRIELMCNGSISLEPREGGGTRVTVTIPQA
ncbi:Histidine kinase-, DNA gyrase B-, and HSP90-like ATPase [Ruminococcaceae bacterium KH2T8]|nr:Histidine kinase-, DNA gyrase B-, and HSP90-like ATPase [Ruminococcaceae bacterium KH2T8]